MLWILLWMRKKHGLMSKDSEALWLKLMSLHPPHRAFLTGTHRDEVSAKNFPKSQLFLRLLPCIDILKIQTERNLPPSPSKFINTSTWTGNFLLFPSFLTTWIPTSSHADLLNSLITITNVGMKEVTYSDSDDDVVSQLRRLERWAWADTADERIPRLIQYACLDRRKPSTFEFVFVFLPQ